MTSLDLDSKKLNSALTEVFRNKAGLHKTIMLENKDRIPVGALYLNGMSPDSITVCQTTRANEKFYIYIPSEIGHVAVFFSYWRILN